MAHDMRETRFLSSARRRFSEFGDGGHPAWRIGADDGQTGNDDGLGRCHVDYHINFDKFFDSDVKPNTALVVEMNNCHGETLPGFCKYLLDLGCDVDLMVTHEQAVKDPFCRFQDSRLKKYAFTYEEMLNFLQNSPKMLKYDLALFTSYNLYRRLKDTPRLSFLKHAPNIKIPRFGLLAVIHHLDFPGMDDFPRDRFITLRKIADNGFTAINPHFFGDVEYTGKSPGKTRFGVVGALDETERRNLSLLYEALDILAAQGANDFNVTLIGRGKARIPAAHECRVQLLGKTTYGELYWEMEKFDFLLPLLDPADERHERYISEAISGTYQLSYGFRKPLVIAEKFAIPHGLSAKSAVVYGAGESLAKGMLMAMSMDGKAYDGMSATLDALARDIYQRSLGNFASFLQNIGMR